MARRNSIDLQSLSLIMGVRTLVARGLLCCLGLSVFASFGDHVHATEICPPSPCRDALGGFLDEPCRDAADWIAVGSVADVKHNKKGHPLNKDFASFSFKPEQWEKGNWRADKIRYQVGWCENRTELPIGSTGKLRVYGLNPLPDGNTHYYLDLIAVE